MYHNITLFIIILILILFIYKSKEFFSNESSSLNIQSTDTCNFSPNTTSTWGEKNLDSLEELKLSSRDDCVVACTNLNECSVKECQEKCSACTNPLICEWLPPQVCNYQSGGENIHSCIDKCLNDIKDNPNCGINYEDKYKNCKDLCETCKDSTNCKWLKKKKKKVKCLFDPWGPNKQACLDRCVSSDKYLWGGDDCTINTCGEICNSCVDRHYCKWLNKTQEIEDVQEVNNTDTPPKQNIRCISGDKRIFIQWNTKQHKKYDTIEKDQYKIIGYIIQYYKTYKPIEGIITKTIEESSDEFNKSEFNKNNNTYILDNLDNGDEYSIAIIPINLNGSGRPSNIISIIPKSNIKINIDN